MVQPDRDIPNSNVHRLRAKDVVDAPRFAEIAEELAELLRERTLVAHNVAFDLRFLMQEYRRLGVEFPNVSSYSYDTLNLTKISKLTKSNSLATILEHFELQNPAPHTALGDALSTASLLPHFIQLMEHQNFRTRAVQFSTEALQDPTTGLRPVARPTLPRPSLTAGAQGEHDPQAWLRGLAARLPREGSGAVAEYRRHLIAALADYALSATEIAHLSRVAQDSRLSEDDVLLVHEEFLRQLATDAWLDGVVTEDERRVFSAVAAQLGAEQEFVDTVLGTPPAAPAGQSAASLSLEPGARIALTGTMSLPREEWERRIAAAGLVAGPVTKQTQLVVAADPDSRSGKAKKALKYGIPVVSEEFFAQLIGKMDAKLPAAPEPSPAAWTQRFPWIADYAVAANDLTEAAEAWITDFDSFPLYELSPLLSASTPVDVQLSAKQTYKRWFKKFKRPLEATVRDLADIQGVGEKRLFDIVYALLVGVLDAEDSEADPTFELPEAPDLSVLGWLYLSGALSTDLSSLSMPASLLIDAQDLHLSTPPRDAIASLFAAALEEFWTLVGPDPRHAAIVNKRWLGDATLDAVAQSFGITRERIRQLENQLAEVFAGRTLLYQDIATQIAKRIGFFVSFEDLTGALPVLLDTAPGTRVSYLEFFGKMTEKFERAGEWVQQPFAEEMLADALRSHADADGLVNPEAVAAAVGVDKQYLLERLTRCPAPKDPAVLLIAGTLATDVASHSGRARSVLAAHGEPMTEAAIAEALQVPHDRSMGNAYSNDPGMIRVTAKRWGLARWGMEEYTSIADWIGKQVDSNKTVYLDDLLAECERLEIAPHSVRLYANNGEFVTSNGIVTRGTGEVTFTATPEETPNLYLVDGAWKLLLTVTRDHLRGSGFPLPRAVAVLHNMSAIGEQETPGRLGPAKLRITRNSQCTMSSIRSYLLELGAQEGDRVWLAIDPATLFDVSPIPTNPILPAPLDAIARHTGIVSLPATDDPVATLLAEVNTRLGLPADAPRRKTVARFRDRNQDDIADLITGL